MHCWDAIKYVLINDFGKKSAEALYLSILHKWLIKDNFKQMRVSAFILSLAKVRGLKIQ